jgi:uncharacterized surface protein with fasciclin (FAS1) repeats
MATIASIALNDDRFNILVNAVLFVDSEIDDADLFDTLNTGTADLTVFAPTDAAFGQLAADLGFDGDVSDETAVTNFLTAEVDSATLLDVLQYHLSTGAKTAAEIGALEEIDMLNGGTITPDGPTLVDNEPDLIDPSLVVTDIAADNGIIHAIDRVLLPTDLPDNDALTITEIVAASGEFDTNGDDFDILLQAVLAADLDGALSDVAADLTVFAPTDTAFLNLAEALGFTGTGEEAAFDYVVDALTLLSAGASPIPLLSDILTYHVSPESLQASQIAAAGTVDTVLGPDLGVNGTRLVDAEPDFANPRLIQTDIQASNGVVHVINGVLIPVDLLQSDGANDVDFIIGNGRANVIATGADADFISGKNGDDDLAGGRGNDVILGGGGSDTITGGQNNDTLLGNAQDDVIFGGAGRDVITGGAGDDEMTGGGGADVFVFAAGEERDVIIDFLEGTDKIDLTSFAGLEFDDVTIADGAGDRVLVSFGANVIVLRGENTTDLAESDFIFAPPVLPILTGDALIG